MKKTLFLIMMLCCHIVAVAQMSRRAIEKYSTEAVKQITLTGRTPTIDILDSLANNADVSIEMLSRMGDADDVRQQHACLKLIDDIVAYSLKPTGMKYVDVVRQGLKKAIDRSYEPDVQQHVLEQLALVAKPNDVAHVAMYLEIDQLAPTVAQMLVAMPDIDDRLAEAAKTNPAVKEKLLAVISARRGKAASASSTIAGIAPAQKQKPTALPLWTESLRREVESIARQPSPVADSLIIMDNARKALPELLRLASRREGADRNAVLARFLVLADHAAQKGELNGTELYLLLRDADALVADDVLRTQIVVAMGRTHTVQAFVYITRYYGKEQYADAMALAVTEFVATYPEMNRGKLVNALLYKAKQSFIRHYDEQGVDAYIDQALAAIDNWRADGALNLSHTEQTSMEKRGFWVMHDELTDFDMAFDWRAEGLLTLSLHSTPILKFDAKRGVCVEGENKWHKFEAVGEWSTANVSVKGNKLSVAVNGKQLVSQAQPLTINTPASGFTKILADDAGAVVRQYCFRKK